MLILIKILHTLIWVFMAMCVLYILYCGITRRIDKKLYFAALLLVLEGLVLLLLKGECPLAIIAKKYAAYQPPGFDIYLPEWFLPYNIPLFLTLYIIGVILIGINIYRKKNKNTPD